MRALVEDRVAAADRTTVLAALARLPDPFGPAFRERLGAAVVLGSHGDPEVLAQLVELAALDWRDALVAGGLADDDWPQRLDRALP